MDDDDDVSPDASPSLASSPPSASPVADPVTIASAPLGGVYPVALPIYRTAASLYATVGNGGGGGGGGGGGDGREDAWSEGDTSALVDAWGRDSSRSAATVSATPAVAGGRRRRLLP
ncbi:unnamed protein product [Urochloa humidicola]